MPQPSGYIPPNKFEKFWTDFWNNLVIPPVVRDFFEQSKEFFLYIWQNYSLYIGIGLSVFFVFFCINKFFRKKEKKIKKLWLFTLFFLSKRQMFIPLIYRLAQKDKNLEEKELQEILDARLQCKKISLKKKPKDRFLLEKKLSQALAKYFTNLESQEKIKENSKFYKILQDLEFIDKKLSELHKIYNSHVHHWNNYFNKKILLLFFKIFRFKRFEMFF